MEGPTGREGEGGGGGGGGEVASAPLTTKFIEIL